MVSRFVPFVFNWHFLSHDNWRFYFVVVFSFCIIPFIFVSLYLLCSHGIRTSIFRHRSKLYTDLLHFILHHHPLLRSLFIWPYTFLQEIAIVFLFYALSSVCRFSFSSFWHICGYYTVILLFTCFWNRSLKLCRRNCSLYVNSLLLLLVINLHHYIPVLLISIQTSSQFNSLTVSLKYHLCYCSSSVFIILFPTSHCTAHFSHTSTT